MENETNICTPFVTVDDNIYETKVRRIPLENVVTTHIVYQFCERMSKIEMFFFSNV